MSLFLLVGAPFYRFRKLSFYGNEEQSSSSYIVLMGADFLI